MRLGLALSGGGLRATFFHLGVIRYLSEHGALGDVKHVTSVSGGSILAAHLVLNWSLYLDPARFEEARRKLVAFAEMDIRGRILRRLPSHFPLAYFGRTRLRRPRTTSNLLFEAFLTDYLYGDSTLRDARLREPGAPSLDILATNLTRGTLAYFTDDHFVPDALKNERVNTEIPMAKAVAISAAFPGFFPPIELDHEALGVDYENFPTTEYLTDGGVYDNLGLRRFRTLLVRPEPPVDHILVCDASGHFDWVDSHKDTMGMLRTALRSTEIFMKRLAELENEVFALDGEDRFSLIRISDELEPASPPMGDFLSLAEQKLLKNMRTDLDYFSSVEIEALELHGYSIAGEKCKSICGGNARLASRSDETHKKAGWLEILKKSRFRRLRLVSLRDRISYVHLLVLVTALLIPATYLIFFYMRESFLSSLQSYERNTFGQFEFGSPAEASQLLDKVEAAQKRWPGDAVIQTEVAVAAYSVYSKTATDPERSFKLFERALTELKGLPELPEREQMRYHQLRGHYLLAEGERLRRAGNTGAAETQYLAALASYESFRRLSFRDLHGLEFNLCNTARMLGRLDYALARCEAADRYARENRLNFWQPKAIMGRIYESKGDLSRAATVLHEAWEIASRASAGDERMLKDYLEWDVERYPELCQEPSFLQDLGDLCPTAAGMKG